MTNPEGLLNRLQRQQGPEAAATVAGEPNGAPADEPVDAAGIAEALLPMGDTSTPPPVPPPPAPAEPVQQPYDGAVPWSVPSPTSLFSNYLEPGTTAGSLFNDPEEFCR